MSPELVTTLLALCSVATVVNGQAGNSLLGAPVGGSAFLPGGFPPQQPQYNSGCSFLTCPPYVGRCAIYETTCQRPRPWIRCPLQTVCLPRDHPGCETALCPFGSTCVLREIFCISAPCLPLPTCVSQFGNNFGSNQQV